MHAIAILFAWQRMHGAQKRGLWVLKKICEHLGKNRSFHQELSGALSYTDLQALRAARTTGIIFLISSAVEHHRFTLVNTS